MTESSNWKQKWIDAIAPDEPHKLVRRLAWDGWPEASFERWLRCGASDGEGEPAWRLALADCRRHLSASWDDPILPWSAGERRPFIDLWWPIRTMAMDRLAADVTGDGGAAAPEVYAALADVLLERLCETGEQALWESFSCGRSPGTALLAHLGANGDGLGPPLRDAYRAFVEANRRDGLSAILAEFPKLGRYIGLAFALWFDGSRELLLRVHSDRKVLEREFAIPADYRLTGVRQGLSDPHRGGRAVAILEFAGGDPDRVVRVVYKPKDLRVDGAYQALLRDLNSASALPSLRILSIYASDGYGYMEFVPHKLSADAAELRSFYVNAGRLTALLHWLGCTDCHFENLIACGDQLLLVDTETLLEPDLPNHVRDASIGTAALEPTQLQERFAQSVLHTGLLPQWSFLGNEKQPVDISALGISPLDRATRVVDGWLGINSDGMIPGQIERVTDVPTSLPVGTGEKNPFPVYLDAFCDGFGRQNEVLIAQREELLGAGGALARFAGLQRRIVLRATRIYKSLQRQMLEPDALRSGLGQALRLEQLTRSFLLADAKPFSWPVLGAERAQMLQLDVPFFTNAIGDKALILDEIGETLPDFFETSALASARDRLARLDEQEVGFQLKLVRGLVTARQLDVTDAVAQSSVADISPGERERSAAAGDVDAAVRVVDHLAEQSFSDPRGEVEWLGPTLGADGDKFVYGPVGTSLYSGSIGIACLIERLRDRSKLRSEIGDLQSRILRPLRDLAQEPSPDNRLRWWRDQPLGLGGCGGLLLALQELGEIAIVDALVESAHPRFIEADQQLDLLGGCVGLIGPLSGVASEAAHSLLLRTGEHLLANQGDDGGWLLGPRGRTVTGFAHGPAGYAAAMARLHQTTKDDRFRDAGVKALERERADLARAGRGEDGSADGSAFARRISVGGWCNGRLGVAFGRACLWQTDLWDAECEREIAAAIDDAVRIDDLGRDHLCCGNIGMMLGLRILSAGPWPVPAALQQKSAEAAARHRDRALRGSFDTSVSWRCFGTREGSVTLPGFFTGLSGMSLALLFDERSQSAAARLFSAGLLSAH